MALLKNSHPVPALVVTGTGGETQMMRRTAETDLDEKMRGVLNEPGKNPYVKIRKYNALLQRYLNFVKQGVKEEDGRINHPKISEEEKAADDKGDRDGGGGGGDVPLRASLLDETGEEVLLQMAPRDRKNASYILKKINESEGGWTQKGEFVYKGKAVKGSHMLDLIKHLSAPYKKTPRSTPTGWLGFLHTLHSLNIPVTALHNPQVREQYRQLRLNEGKEGFGGVQRASKRNIVLSPRWSRALEGGVARETLEEEEEEEVEEEEPTLYQKNRQRTSKRKSPSSLAFRWTSPSPAPPQEKTKITKTKRKKPKTPWINISS
ncbi:acintoc2 [Scomber scombrus]|uniref:TPA_asm: acintoc2 n=1 Tax=Scomber scombrus TaxID=13677 RepID=A0AAV1QDX3_SCOSC